LSHDKITTDLTIPRLPRSASVEVSAHYIDQLVAALDDAIHVLDGVRRRTFSEITLTNTKENGANLRVGTVFSDGGTLKIARTGDVFAASLVGTTSLGSVTVSTP
jgi:hypothetical protein